MPSVPLTSELRVLARAASICLALALACEKRSPTEKRPPEGEKARASASAVRVRRPPPAGDFACQDLRPPPPTEAAATSETIELRPPGTGKKVFTSKTGVVVTFDREEFLQAARCLKFEKAIRYIEEETGVQEESAIMDAFQMSYVAAALLDAGRASVRPVDEKAPRKSIVRDGWAEDGCGGRCRSFGRLYRLSPDDPSFFLRITDQTRNEN